MSALHEIEFALTHPEDHRVVIAQIVATKAYAERRFGTDDLVVTECLRVGIDDPYRYVIRQAPAEPEPEWPWRGDA